MKNSIKILLAFFVILTLAWACLFYFRGRPRHFLNQKVASTFKVLLDEKTWRGKLIKSDNPMSWNVPEVNTQIKAENYQKDFYCGGRKANFVDYFSYSAGAGSVGGWNSISVIDCTDYYFVFEYGDAGPKLFGPFKP
ncbi:MAG: hypothetical protein PHV93_02645 [Candidatus Pacebacteria bacterium]|nr:hypothetical protein [Candidatus Paceibacterota bacterium]